MQHDPPPNEPDAPRQPSASTEQKQFLIIGGLLVMVIATLAVLWVRERSARAAAEQRANEIAKQSQDLPQMLNSQAMAAALAQFQNSQPQPIRREECPAREITLDGDKRTGFEISPAVGKRIGDFQPGDILLIGPAKPAPPE